MIEPTTDEIAYKIIIAAINNIAVSKNFEKLDSSLLHDLAVRTNNFIHKHTVKSKFLADVGCRTAVDVKDVELSLEEDNISLKSLAYFSSTVFKAKPLKYSRRKTRPAKTKLKINDERPMPSWIPSFFPRFPEPHSFAKTQLVSDVEMSYGRIRINQSKARVQAIRSLIRFSLAIHGDFCLFRQKHNDEHDQAVSEIEKQEAALEARRARYSVEKSSEMDRFELKETTTSIVRQKIPEYTFVILPFRVRDTLCTLVTQGADPDKDNHAFLTNNLHPIDSFDIDVDTKMEFDDAEFMDELMLSPDSVDGL